MTLSGFPGPIRFDRFTLSPEQRSLTSGGAPVALSSRAYDILVLLLKRSGKVVSKDELLSEVWAGTVVEESNLAVQLSGLRRALGERSDGGPFILTVQGRGYRFVCPVSGDDGQRQEQKSDGREAADPSVKGSEFRRDPRPAVKPLIARAGLPTLVLTNDHSSGPPSPVAALKEIFQEELNLALGRSRLVRVVDTGVFPPVEADYALRTAIRCDETSAAVSSRLIRRSDAVQALIERKTIGADEASIRAEAARVAFAAEHAISLGRLHLRSTEPDAYGLLLQGYRLRETLEPENMRAAALLFEAAAAADPSMSAPVAALASLQLSWPMVSPSKSSYVAEIDRGIDVAKKAIAIDPWDAWSHVILGLGHLRRRRGFSARQSFERAVELQPDSPVILSAVGGGFAFLGEADRAIRLCERAIVLHPAPPRYFFSYLAIALAVGGQHDRALDCLGQANSIIPSNLALEAACLSALGHSAKASELANRFFRRTEERWSGSSPASKTSILDWLDQTSLHLDGESRRQTLAGLDRLSL